MKTTLRSITAVLLAVCTVISGCGLKVEQQGPDTCQIMEGAVVSYLGPEGTYTEEAAQFFFGDAVFVASCEANKIDDIIVEVHNAGLELVTIHDRPEGSDLGSYHYVLEVENKNAITDKQLKVVEKFPEIRSLGSFDVMEKRN